MDHFLFKLEPEIQQHAIHTLHKILNSKKLLKKKRRKSKKKKRFKYATFGDDYEGRNIISLDISKSPGKKEKASKSSFFDRMSKPKVKHFTLEKESGKKKSHAKKSKQHSPASEAD